MKIKGRYSRYMFFKKLYKRHIVLIKGKNKYYAYDRDLDILKFINFNMEYINSSLSYLDKYSINYIVLDNLDVIVDKVYSNNNYKKYLKLIYLKNILLKIGNI